MDQKKIGNFIAICRKEKKITQAELAEKLGVSNRTISNWENGKYLPDYGVLIPLCKELDITIIELFDGEKHEIEANEKKYLQQVEKVIDFVSFKQEIDIKQCKKIGKILFIGGITLYLFSLFILTNRDPAYYRVLMPVGGLLSILGFSYMNKFCSRKNKIISNVIAIMIFILSFSTYDFINMVFFNKEPKFYYSCGYMGGSEYCEMLLYDSYRCFTKDDKYHITYKGKVDVYGKTKDVFNFCD